MDLQWDSDLKISRRHFQANKLICEFSKHQLVSSSSPGKDRRVPPNHRIDILYLKCWNALFCFKITFSCEIWAHYHFPKKPSWETRKKKQNKKQRTPQQNNKKNLSKTTPQKSPNSLRTQKWMLWLTYMKCILRLKIPVYFLILSLKCEYSGDSICERFFWLPCTSFMGAWLATTPLKNKQVGNDCGSIIT